ncbi:hypothetical protein AB1Y20_016893 [Prymnesium parvum]|uniref:DUF1995 domain-containing protein n=1 Tax=Prymnesium parvum TaxID=97485 RepID=A0AB34ID69_PRYPA
MASALVLLAAIRAPTLPEARACLLQSRSVVSHVRMQTTTAPPATFPANPKELATQLSLAVQASLAEKHRKLEVRLPTGLCFGLFGPAGEQMIGTPDAMIPEETQQRGERELAFLMAEIFQSYESACAVVFPDAKSAALAERDFTRRKLQPRIVSSLRELSGRPKAGFGSKAKGAAVPPKIIILVRPQAKDVRSVTLPEEGVILLLNPAKDSSKQGFEPIYTMIDNPHPDWKGGILFRSFPSSWALGVAGKRGPVIHGRQDTRPTLDEIDVGFERVKSDKSLLSQAGGFLSQSGAAAGLERRGASPD